MSKIISYGKQFIDEDDIDSVINVLKSDYLTTGPAVDKFENELCEYTGYSHCSVVSSGTAALHCAMDYAGQRCDYSRIKEICIKYGLVFILDACHSLGNMVPNEENPEPDIICYSFHPVKHITTGEGGGALTNDEKLHQRMHSFRNHGRFGLEMIQLGFNNRMPDINAAL